MGLIKVANWGGLFPSPFPLVMDWKTKRQNHPVSPLPHIPLCPRLTPPPSLSCSPPPGSLTPPPLIPASLRPPSLPSTPTPSPPGQQGNLKEIRHRYPPLNSRCIVHSALETSRFSPHPPPYPLPHYLRITLPPVLISLPSLPHDPYPRPCTLYPEPPYPIPPAELKSPAKRSVEKP